MAGNKDLYIIDNLDIIKNFMKEKSSSMSLYIEEHPNSEFVLLYKYLTHSDLTNRGKRNGMQETLDKNYLYYLSTDQMQTIEHNESKTFESAKQSNIGVSDAFYGILGIPRLQRRDGPQTTQHEHILLNNYCDVFLVNDTMRYFNINYTKKILESLNKPIPDWVNDNMNITLNNESPFTPIQLSEAIHGLGTAQNEEFHKLRLSMFKKDTFILLIEKNEKKKNLFVLLEKNPRKNDDAVQSVANSIKEFGFKVPIVIDNKGTIVSGHTRYKASKLLGLEEVPCIVADDLTPKQIKAFRIADNKVGELAEWDFEFLNKEIKGLEDDFNLEDFGFNEIELLMAEDIEPEKYDSGEFKEYEERARGKSRRRAKRRRQNAKERKQRRIKGESRSLKG